MHNWDAPNDFAFSGSQLGRGYTFPGLQRTFDLDYVPTRDDHHIEQIIAPAIAPQQSDTTVTTQPEQIHREELQRSHQRQSTVKKKQQKRRSQRGKQRQLER
jgi:hypothetical protein